MAWYLFLLAVAGGVVFAIWNYRRKAAASRAASEARFEQLFKGQAQVPAKPQPSLPAAAPANEWSAPAKEPAESLRVVAVIDAESAAGAGTVGTGASNPMFSGRPASGLFASTLRRLRAGREYGPSSAASSRKRMDDAT